jgi:hypothetical protein
MRSISVGSQCPPGMRAPGRKPGVANGCCEFARRKIDSASHPRGAGAHPSGGLEAWVLAQLNAVRYDFLDPGWRLRTNCGGAMRLFPER